MTPRSISSLAASWATGIASVFLTQAHLWVGLLCAIASLVASIYAIMVARTTLNLRLIEMRDRICEDCVDGRVIVDCKVPESERPTDCYLRKKT